MTGWPPPDAELVAMAARSNYAEMARQFRRSVRTVMEHVQSAHARLILPRRPQQEARKTRPCLWCGKPHDSAGPGDRYHRDCRSMARNRDDGRIDR